MEYLGGHIHRFLWLYYFGLQYHIILSSCLLFLLVWERKNKSRAVSILSTATIYTWYLSHTVQQLRGCGAASSSVPVFYYLWLRVLTLSMAKQFHLIFYSTSYYIPWLGMLIEKEFMRNCLLVLKQRALHGFWLLQGKLFKKFVLVN